MALHRQCLQRVAAHVGCNGWPVFCCGAGVFAAACCAVFPACHTYTAGCRCFFPTIDNTDCAALTARAQRLVCMFYGWLNFRSFLLCYPASAQGPAWAVAVAGLCFPCRCPSLPFLPWCLASLLTVALGVEGRRLSVPDRGFFLFFFFLFLGPRGFAS